MTNTSRKSILWALRIGLIINLVLTLIKLIFGYWGHAQALISDGYNSASDLLISVMLLFVLKIATKKPDSDHPYGHEKFEGLAYFVLGLVFLGTSIYIGIDAIIHIIHHIQIPEDAIKPHLVTVAISIIALVIKLVLFLYYKSIGKKYNSPTIKADAKNHQIDVYATSFSVIGLGIAQLGLVVFDDIAAFIIGLFILRLAITILREAISFLTDQAPSFDEINHIKSFIHSINGVLKVDDLKVRKHMTQRYVDVEIGVLANMSLEEAHRIAEDVHHQVEKAFPDVIHCMVHVNPKQKT